jgi:ankyrin repeat protein
MTMKRADAKLFDAVMDTDVRTIRTALVGGAWIHARREYSGDTALHIAAANLRCGAIDELLKAGADPNAQNRAGRTPLHEAAFHCTPDVWNKLIEGGAMDDIRDKDGVSPQSLRDTLAHANAMVDYTRRQAGLEPGPQLSMSR